MTGILEDRYWRDYYELKLLEVQNEQSEEEKFFEMVDNLSRKELPIEIIRSGLKNFGKTIQGGGFAFLTLELIEKDIFSLKVIHLPLHSTKLFQNLPFFLKNKNF